MQQPFFAPGKIETLCELLPCLPAPPGSTGIIGSGGQKTTNRFRKEKDKGGHSLEGATPCRAARIGVIRACRAWFGRSGAQISYWRNGQVNESRAVGGVSEGLPLKYRDFTRNQTVTSVNALIATTTGHSRDSQNIDWMGQRLFTARRAGFGF